MVSRIHILGASGSGTTTLGITLSKSLQCAHFDSDDYFWLPTDPPFTRKRDLAQRQERLMADLRAADAWVLSGSLCGWGDVAIPLFERVIYLWVPSELRIERLRQREAERYGERIAIGGDLYDQSQAFLTWAAGYDDGGLEVRSRHLHETWLGMVSCPVLRIEGEYTYDEHLEMVMSDIQP